MHQGPGIPISDQSGRPQALSAMSGAAPGAESGREGFTCSALLMCLYLPGLSKKKPEEAISTSPPTAETAPAPAPGQQPAEQQEAPYAPSRAASLEKSECASLYSRNNIVFDFVAEEGDQAAIHGYCPSPCFDLPAELIRAGERFGVVAADSEATTPVTATFVFDDGQRGGALKKMASCLAPGVDGNSEPRPPHLARFLSASGRSNVSGPLVMPSRDAPQGESLMVPACKRRATAA